jgi:hypothetical protein
MDEGHKVVLHARTPSRATSLAGLSSGMHRGSSHALQDVDWTERWNPSQDHSESKLYVTTLALAIAHRWPDVLTHAVDPG